MQKYLILLLLLSSTNLIAAIDSATCNSVDVDDFLHASELKQLTITTNKTRKWAKNYIRILTNESNNIEAKYKKKFKAKITATYNNGLSCELDARIRINGDWKDHVQDAPPNIASLDVKLESGNILSIVKFKLLLPHTRNGDNEIFVATLLGELGYISPRTFYVPVNFNGTDFTYIFQEKAVKELLEYHLFREGPILEGDERFTWTDTDRFLLDNRIGLSKLVNRNWAEKGTNSLFISQSAVSRLNDAYLEFVHRNFSNGKGSRGGPPFGWLLENKYFGSEEQNTSISNSEFTALLLALDAKHALRPHNRKFYYDPIYQRFEPIYYDGDAGILKPVRQIKSFDKYFLPSSTNGVASAINKINAIDKKNIHKKINSNGVKITQEQLDQKLDLVTRRLNDIQNHLVSFSPETSIEQPYYKQFDKDIRLAFATDSPRQIEICDINLDNCERKLITIAQFSDLLGGRQIDSNLKPILFVSDDKARYINHRYLKPKAKSTEKSIALSGGGTLKLYGEMLVDVDPKKQQIILTQSAPNGRALISGGVLTNWNIDFNGYNSAVNTDGQRFNDNLLTGCLTIIDTTLSNVSLSVQTIRCEDGLNLIRAKGELNQVLIKDSMSDALDMDFSELKIEKIIVENAGNDCMDVSAGTYIIETALLNNCTDKAFSAGEASTSLINNLQVNNANVAVAVKDSSKSTIKTAQFHAVTQCLAAYRKKQEYWGGTIVAEHSICSKDKIFIESGSKLESLQ